MTADLLTKDHLPWSNMWVSGLRLYRVGALGFEPRASCTPCKRASRAAPRPDLYAHYIPINTIWQPA
jgi:hypothetical protein